MIKKTLISIAVVVLLFLGFVAMRSADFRVERSATIAAPPDALFLQINNPRQFNRWNPFLKFDPNVKITYKGPDAGVGAMFNWEGDHQVGAGSATIIESQPGDLVRMRMDWKRPMEGTSTVDFTFRPEGGKTVVTWAMYGRNGFMGKLVSLFMDCDKMCGPQFEQGLADLGKAVSKVASED